MNQAPEGGVKKRFFRRGAKQLKRLKRRFGLINSVFMNLNLVVRELAGKGMNRGQIIDNLKELGVGDAESIYEKAMSETPAKPQPQSPQTQPRQPAQSQQPQPSPAKLLAPKREEELFEEVKPLQPQERRQQPQNPQQRYSQQYERKPDRQPEGLMEEVAPKRQEPKILFPTIVQEGPEGEEKEVVGPKEEDREAFEERRRFEESEKGAGGGSGRQESIEQLEKQLGQFESLPQGSLEEKIDETIALLKALKALNQQILETDRKVLLRIK